MKRQRNESSGLSSVVVYKENRFRYRKETRVQLRISTEAWKGDTDHGDSISVKRNPKSIEVGVITPLPNFEYITWIMYMQESSSIPFVNCAIFGGKNPAKEMSETGAALRHVLDHLGHRKRYLSQATVIIPGDGCAPRTGLPLACLSNWTVYSIDPMMRDKWTNRATEMPDNLVCINGLIEEFELPDTSDLIIILAVHSHISLPDLWDRLLVKYPRNSLLVLSMPCCPGYDQVLPEVRPILDIHDTSIMSVKNHVLMYKMNLLDTLD